MSIDQNREDAEWLVRQDYRVAISPQLSRPLVELAVAEPESRRGEGHPGVLLRKAVTIIAPGIQPADCFAVTRFSPECEPPVIGLPIRAS